MIYELFIVIDSVWICSTLLLCSFLKMKSLDVLFFLSGSVLFFFPATGSCIPSSGRAGLNCVLSASASQELVLLLIGWLWVLGGAVKLTSTNLKIVTQPSMFLKGTLNHEHRDCSAGCCDLTLLVKSKKYNAGKQGVRLLVTCKAVDIACTF